MSSRSSRGTGSVALDNPIGGVIGLAALGVSVWALVCAARITLAAAAQIIDLLLQNGASEIPSNILLSGITGVFAGLAVVALRAWPRRPGHLAESFVPALVSKGLAAPVLGEVFWARVLLGGTIGFAVGALTARGESR